MNTLLEQSIKAHGGLANWNKLNWVKLCTKISGLLWQMKGHPNLLNDTTIIVDTKKQYISYKPKREDWFTSFEPNRVAVHLSNNTNEELLNPRQSFANHTKETKWTRLQMIYFASYAMWNYINIPFVFANSDYEVKEMETWKENGETWKRIQVIFPNHIVTHSHKQTFYIDETGLIRRHDYNVELIGNGRSSHYLYDYQEVNGIKFPTKRRVFARLEDNTSLQPEPLLVSIDVTDIELVF
ncbi:MAG: hypothetical protein JST34_13440 [Bacteroidetes bacterium]|nr:hypothetical protein [Bacteroidota bacterium]